MKSSLKNYLKKSIFLYLLLASLVILVWLYLGVKNQINQSFDESLVQSATTIDDFLSESTVKNILYQASITSNQSIDPLVQADNIDGNEYKKSTIIQVWSTDNTLIYKSSTAPLKPISKTKTGFHRIVIDHKVLRNFSLYSKKNRWWIFVAESDELRDKLVRKAILKLIIPIILGIPLLLFLINLLINRSVLQLNKLNTALLDREHHDLTLIDNIDNPTEISSIVSSLNKKFETLESSYKQGSHLFHELAHELKNHLAIQLIFIDTSLEVSNNPQSVESKNKQILTFKQFDHHVDELEKIKRGLLHLNEIISQTKILSQSRNIISKDVCSKIYLIDLTEKVKQEYKRELENKSQVLFVNVNKDHHFYGYKNLFLILLGNLLSNASIHTDEGSEIYINTKVRDKNKIEVICEDNGLDLPEEEILKLTDLYYCSKSPSATYIGSGVGLSIVDAIVQKHRGLLVISKSSTGGLKVTITLSINALKP